MTVGSLRSELLGIPGIESAEIEGDVGAPSGVKVRLAPGADAVAVSEQVQRILAAHGLSSELSPEEEAALAPLPERLLVAAPEPAYSDEAEDEEEEEEGEEAPEEAVGEEEEEEEEHVEAAGPAVVIEHAPPRPAVAAGWLASIAVEEDREGVSVVATADDGSSATRRVPAEGRGLDEAVVAAVGALAGPGLPDPVLLAVAETEIEGSTVLTLVLEMAGRRMAGSTIVEGGRPYAVGRAAWAALSAR
ncbi:MAG: hypothetical protein EHM57_02715 [Actinobacteria bacterium]|nr:MAG: hypothetical protein EHM57_02715 [Actinomycetota bacterium]